VLLGIELAQGLVGFVQYFTDLPIVLVAIHMLGAAAISGAVTWTLIGVREPDEKRRRSARTPVNRPTVVTEEDAVTPR
jgi:cytochrome c oxidase assembly protein subunit 15